MSQYISKIKVYVYEVVYDIKNNKQQKKYSFKKIKKREEEEDKSITPKNRLEESSNKQQEYIFSMNTITNNLNDSTKRNNSLNELFSKNNLSKLYNTIYLGHPTRIDIDQFKKPSNNPNIYDFSTFYKLIQECIIKYTNYYTTLNPSIPSNNLKFNSEIIYRIKTKPEEKIIVIGDIHGSFHSFFRIFIRLYFEGIITNEYKISDNYRIVFLGDVIDRGNFSIEVMYIIFKLINNNNNSTNLKVILLRGNHEEKETFTEYGFEKEIKHKFRTSKEGVFYGRYSFLYNYANPTKIIELISEFYKIIPSAIILHHCTTAYWLCHGGFPIKKVYLPHYSYLPDISKIPEVEEYIKINNNYNSQIRWNDFISSSQSTCSKRDQCTYSLFQIGTQCLKNFLEIRNIDFIIRGHNDNESNAMLLAKYKKNSQKKFFHINTVESSKKIDSLFPEETIEYSKIENRKTKKEIATIYPNKFSKNKFVSSNTTNTTNISHTSHISLNKKSSDTEIELFPVLTISNNSDNGRSLHPDSYIIITSE